MRKILLSFVVFVSLLTLVPSHATEVVLSKDDPVILQWNRYTTKNFEILSVDDAQGKYLYDNIEFIKTWILWRWGIKDIDFSVDDNKQIIRCKVVVVPNKELYFKLFNKKEPTWRVEIKDNKVEGVIWIISEDVKWNTSIPTQLTEVILTNFEVNYQTKFPFWCKRGVTLLNSKYSDIKSSFNSTVDSKYVLEMTSESYLQLNVDQRAAFDSQATILCLWLKKEKNGKVFLDFLSASMAHPQSAIQTLGFDSYFDFDQKLKIYSPKLATVSNNYLTW